MSWFSDFFSGGVTKEKQNNSQQVNNTSTTTSGSQVAKEEQRSGTTKTTTETGTQARGKQTTLSAQAIANLESALGSFMAGANANGEAVTQLSSALGQGVIAAGALRDWASGAAERSDAAINAIMAEQTRKANIGLGQQNTALGQAAGSNANSLVAALAAENRGNVASQLAATEGQMRMVADQQVAGQLGMATQALGQVLQSGSDFTGTNAASLSAIAEALKGGMTETASESQQTMNSVSQIDELVKTLINQKAMEDLSQTGTVSSSGSGSASRNISIMDIANLLMG